MVLGVLPTYVGFKKFYRPLSTDNDVINRVFEVSKTILMRHSHVIKDASILSTPLKSLNNFAL